MIRERVRRYFENRLPRSDSWILAQRNLYILPTRAGWAFAVTLLVMLLASINYQLNLGFALTFTLCGAGLVAIGQTHANLRGLTLRVRSPQPVHAGEPATIEIVLDNPGRERHGVGLRVYSADHRATAWVDVPAHGTALARLAFVPDSRGRHLLPALLAETNFPLGLLRAWTVWRPAAQVLCTRAPSSRSRRCRRASRCPVACRSRAPARAASSRACAVTGAAIRCARWCGKRSRARAR